MQKPRWPLWAMMGLGLWLTAVPFAYGWTSDAGLMSGLLGGMTVFGLSLFCRLHEPMAHLAYLNAFVGAWTLGTRILDLAPGPLWDGPALIALAVALPAIAPPPTADAPPGWHHNPSAWVQRGPIVALALLGCLGARGCPYSATASLAALVAALTGDRRRWRTAPWSIGLSLAATGAALLAAMTRLGLEGPGPGAAASATAAVFMLALSVDEVLASRLFLRHAPQLGQAYWDAFFNGGLLPRDDFMPRPDHRAVWAPPELPVRRRHSRRKRR